jgi:hypothetical protein
MKALNFLYTDGRDVVVTDSSLHAKGSQYSLKGIVDFSLEIIKPKLLPAILTMFIGVFLIMDAFYYWIPDTFMESFYLPVTGDGRAELELITGIVITLVGIGYLLFSRKRYALCIETAEGNKNVVISKRKEYINQVIDALQKAKNSWRAKRVTR